MDLDEKATVRFETMPGKQGQMDCGFFEEHHQHYRRLTLKHSMDVENPLLEQGNIIDFPLKSRDLSRYDEVLYE